MATTITERRGRRFILHIFRTAKLPDASDAVQGHIELDIQQPGPEGWPVAALRELADQLEREAEG